MENYTVKKLASDSILIELEAAKVNSHREAKILGFEFKKLTIDESLIFIQEEDFIFDINTLLYLDIDPGFRLLKKGSYPLKLTQGKVQIIVTLSRYR